MTARHFYLPLLLVLFVAACDSNDDDDSDIDLLVGTHVAVKVEDNSGDQTATFDQLIDQFRVVIRPDGTYTLDIDFSAAAETAGRTDATFAGRYEVDERNKTFTLKALQVQGFPTTTDVAFNYEVLSEDQVRFSTGVTLFNLLLNSNYQGQLRITVARQ